MAIVKLTTSMAGADFSFAAGDYVECSETTAGNLRDSQQGEHADRVPEGKILHKMPGGPGPKPVPPAKPTKPTTPATPEPETKPDHVLANVATDATPLAKLKLDDDTAARLQDGIEALPESDRPTTVEALVAIDEAKGLESLTRVGKVTAKNIRAAIESLSADRG